MSNPWQKMSSLSSNLKKLAVRICPPTLLESYLNHTTQQSSTDVPPLSFPEIPNRLSLLLDLGASEDYARLLYAQFIDAAQKVETTLSQHYDAEAFKLCGLFAIGSRASYIQAYQNHLIILRTQTIERLWNAMFSRAQSVMINESLPTRPDITPSSSSTSSPSVCVPSGKRKRQGRPPPFTAEQTFALNALFARDDQYSSEDKEFIAQSLNLTRDQVNRWFCNARARKKSSSAIPPRCESPDSIRTVSSDLTISVESHQTELSSVADTPAQNHLQTPGDLTHTLAARQDQSLFNNHITNWSEGVSQSAPVLSSTSPLDCQVAATSVPTDPSLCPEAQQRPFDVTSFNDTLFETFSLTSIQPLPPFPPPVPEHPQSSDLFPDGFDLSQW